MTPKIKAMIWTTFYFAPAMFCGGLMILLGVFKTLPMEDAHWGIAIIYLFGGLVAFGTMTLYLIPKGRIRPKEERNTHKFAYILFGMLFFLGSVYLIFTGIWESPVNLKKIIIFSPFIFIGILMLYDGITGKRLRMLFNTKR